MDNSPKLISSSNIWTAITAITAITATITAGGATYVQYVVSKEVTQAVDRMEAVFLRKEEANIRFAEIQRQVNEMRRKSGRKMGDE